MKLLTFLILSLSALSNPAKADVNHYHAMNVFKGTYQYVDADNDITLQFTIDNRGQIALKKNNLYYFAKTNIGALGNQLGPDGLSVMTIMLSGGSDEQTETIFIRVYPKQDDKNSGAVVKLLDVVYAENDGPNYSSSVVSQPSALLYKQDASGKLAKVKRD